MAASSAVLRSTAQVTGPYNFTWLAEMNLTFYENYWCYSIAMTVVTAIVLTITYDENRKK